ncbi:MAG: NYN domain-containing protein [Aphanothece sp. CMT-3BRIN-NPC111]|nr:NYN domain-containing protein [Aphanothece sp. CMT-3BRIN-NPC111]
MQQELLQTRQQVEELRTAIARLEELTSNPVPATDITPLASVLQDLHSANQPFNTAIFYDIENLVMGNRQPIFNFSLRAIIQKVKEIPGVKQLAIQCAYANWSDPRLGRMRNDILELGIEPIQIFGFNSQKNAADIQLVIDVIELYYHRFSIENFVIVSGDGAFASLAKKLHEYGKIVIGCAYERQVNRVLKSVCDAFIPLPDPREEIKITFSETSTIKTIAQSDTQLSHNNFVVIIREKLELLKHENETRSYLEKSGIAISQVHHFLKRHISNFEERRKLWGYNKLLSLLKIAAEETNLCISKDNINLILKKDVNIESNIFYRHTFSAKSQSSTKYREILKTGYPLFNLPLLEHLRMVIRYAINNRPKGETWQEFEEQLRKTIGQEVSRRAIQRSLTALRSAGCFQEQPSPESWQLQPCILNSNLESEEAILDALRNSMRKKLLEELLEIDESILQEILP